MNATPKLLLMGVKANSVQKLVCNGDELEGVSGQVETLKAQSSLFLLFGPAHCHLRPALKEAVEVEVVEVEGYGDALASEGKGLLKQALCQRTRRDWRVQECESNQYQYHASWVSTANVSFEIGRRLCRRAISTWPATSLPPTLCIH